MLQRLNKDADYMRQALRLAERGYGQTSPNPMVGAVLVKGGGIIGEGWVGVVNARPLGARARHCSLRVPEPSYDCRARGWCHRRALMVMIASVVTGG